MIPILAIPSGSKPKYTLLGYQSEIKLGGCSLKVTSDFFLNKTGFPTKEEKEVLNLVTPTKVTEFLSWEGVCKNSLWKLFQHLSSDVKLNVMKIHANTFTDEFSPGPKKSVFDLKFILKANLKVLEINISVYFVKLDWLFKNAFLIETIKLQATRLNHHNNLLLLEKSDLMI